MAPLINALIGEYRIVGELGAGGMGTVYKAVHTHLGRVIAIKVLSPDLADGPALQRFYSEANIQSSLNHPGVAEYLGFYEYEGRPCILMEYVDGETLSALIRARGSLPAAEAVRILREIAAVAAHFHALGVVHRDLKASNIKINSAGMVKVLDFGIARHQKAERLTSLGAVVGTPDALAPEQLRGDAVTPATDVWQLGVMFYQMLTGQRPFSADSTQEVFARILKGEYVPASRWQPELPQGLQEIIARCLAKDPAKRYASAVELHRALAALDGGAARPAMAPERKRTLIVASASAGTVVLIILLALAIRSWSGGGGAAPPPPPLPPAVTDTGSGAPQGGADARSITVDTADGTAQVFVDGKLVGSTPYQVQARTGEKVSLVLRREGFQDMNVQLDSAEPHVYTYTLEPRKER